MFLQFPSATRHTRAISRPALVWAKALSLLIALGCAGDVTVAPAPVVDGARLYWALTLNHHAVMLSTVAPYDTIRLTATPRAVDGTPLADLPTPTFTSLDLDRAQVGVDGLVRVTKSGSQIPVAATLAVGNVRHTDTVFINATTVATPPELAAFSIHPGTGDSAKVASGGTQKTLLARAIGTDSAPITGLPVYFKSLDPTMATIDRATGLVRTVRPGHLKMIATVTAYGVTKADTLPFTVGYPVLLALPITARENESGQLVGGFPPNPLMLGPGGTVLISNATSIATDITFDDPTNVKQVDQYCRPPFSILLPGRCGSGNVEAFARDANGAAAFRARSLPVPGVYPFHSTINGTSGTIVVVDESTSLP